jgi:hypothetical protein
MPRPKGSKNRPKEGKAEKALKQSKAAKPGTQKAGSAKKAAADAAAAVAQSSAPGRPVITENNLKKLMRSCNSLKGQQDSLLGSMREEIKNACDKQHLNKEIFALIRKLDKKTPESLNIFLEDLAHYLEISGLEARADSAPSLGMDRGEVAEGDGDIEADEDGEAAEAAADAKPPEWETPGETNGEGLHFGQAPGGSVVTLPERRKAAGG